MTAMFYAGSQVGVESLSRTLHTLQNIWNCTLIEEQINFSKSDTQWGMLLEK